MAFPRKCKTRGCKNYATPGYSWCGVCYKRRKWHQTKGAAHNSFSNKTMRVPCEGKPHIQLIGEWWRVSPTPKGDGANPHWQAAHAYIYKLNERKHRK